MGFAQDHPDDKTGHGQQYEAKVKNFEHVELAEVGPGSFKNRHYNAIAESWSEENRPWGSQGKFPIPSGGFRCERN